MNTKEKNIRLATEGTEFTEIERCDYSVCFYVLLRLFIEKCPHHEAHEGHEEI
ncbi:hypothetical protein J7M23_06010 [Candidatus Sumerlaeota bacterium]|nr:hypothetical protein [Candidatus Sumerlaeota bacterium]